MTSPPGRAQSISEGAHRRENKTSRAGGSRAEEVTGLFGARVIMTASEEWPGRLSFGHP